MSRISEALYKQDIDEGASSDSNWLHITLDTVDSPMKTVIRMRVTIWTNIIYSFGRDGSEDDGGLNIIEYYG